MMRCKVPTLVVSISAIQQLPQAAWRPGLQPPPNLFRFLHEFPASPGSRPSPRTGVWRFKASVIKKPRKGAEDLVHFKVHISALDSPQLKEFFRGGEVTRSSEVSRDLHILPTSLIPIPPP
ncbi:hypothetical protein J1605_014827 [Eschrichtius robustus]|uniref:Uncharacterized protein n=1 Tax=Eschrichtius robustus TaxID=9764 RepID=A0AB34GDA2_ESCRO|nr:hypothetical protein J1605_014827 [Eschrichtius robustus]